MSRKSAQLSRVMKRDGRLCGSHLGGCGRQLASRIDATRDHMIPRSFIAFMPPDRKRDFNDDWNMQPACHKCNNERKGGQLSDWPSYRCRCHHLQIAEDGGMYIHEKTKSRERRHLLVEGGGGGDGTVLKFFAARLPKHPNEPQPEPAAGYRLGQGGHMLVPIPDHSVAAFNWFERARVGEANGRLQMTGDSGASCWFLPDGRIIPNSRHWCARSFPLQLGHLNASRYDPFTPQQAGPPKRSSTR